ncbi:putative per-hexamer repeat protein 5 isoform X17 [Eriocheir sinensis]|uniref:putative per-hexamer repeat protein 5 isoform X17 n=1 Tax=Eriocheir sinensis TaxID=95602 RepID=UPI0021C69872|nr:putative per-hexamer repeat protein 5 isoform X17 [Eriocheir sinensis]
MGHKVSREKVNVVVSLRESLCRLDTLKVSYRGRGCLKRRREIACFTFPVTGWWCAEGIAACEAEGGLRVPLAALKQKDGNRTVQLRCSSGRKTLLKGSMSLERFLDNVEFLHFSLFCDSQDPSVAYTSMRCNGRRCDEAARPPVYHQEKGVKEASSPAQASTTQAGDGSAITQDSTTQAGNGSAITKVSTTETGDGSIITKVSTTGTGDGSAITKVSTTETGDGSAITKVSTTETGDGSAITKVSTTETGDGSVITKVSTTQAGDGSIITKVSTTETGDGGAITKVSTTQAGDAGVITKASTNCETNVVSPPRGTTKNSTSKTLRRRKTKKPKCRPRGTDTVTPEGHSAPYTWTDAFMDGTAICSVVLSCVLLYWTDWGRAATPTWRP